VSPGFIHDGLKWVRVGGHGNLGIQLCFSGQFLECGSSPGYSGLPLGRRHGHKQRYGCLPAVFSLEAARLTPRQFEGQRGVRPTDGGNEDPFRYFPLPEAHHRQIAGGIGTHQVDKATQGDTVGIGIAGPSEQHKVDTSFAHRHLDDLADVSADAKQCMYGHLPLTRLTDHGVHQAAPLGKIAPSLGQG
jgi:hypothetical protein